MSGLAEAVIPGNHVVVLLDGSDVTLQRCERLINVIGQFQDHQEKKLIHVSYTAVGLLYELVFIFATICLMVKQILCTV